MYSNLACASIQKWFDFRPRGKMFIPLGLALLTLSWDKNWDSHSLVNGYPSFYPRITLVAPSPGGLKMGQVRFQDINWQGFHWIHFKPCRCACCWVSVHKWLDFRPHGQIFVPPGGLNMGQIWGFQTLTEKAFNHFFSNPTGVFIGWVLRNLSIFGPVAKFLATCCSQTIKLSTHLKGWCLLLVLGQPTGTVASLMSCSKMYEQAQLMSDYFQPRPFNFTGGPFYKNGLTLMPAGIGNR